LKEFYKQAFRWSLFIIVLIGLLTGARALILGKKRALAQVPGYQTPDTLVQTATVQQGDLDEIYEYLAVVEPVQTANVTARVTARIETITVDEGSKVEQGQTLTTLDDREVRAQLQGVRAQIKQAQAELQGNKATVASLEETLAYWSREAERDMRLAENEAISSSQTEKTIEEKNDVAGKLNAAREKSEAIKQQIHSLEARREEMETTLSYYQLQSPFEGVVTSRLVDPGDQASPGKALLVIESTDALMIAFDVPQNDLPEIEKGLAVAFQAGGQKRHATITRLYPSLNRARMARAEIIISEDQAGGLISGEYLTASVAYQQHRNVSLIPVGALIAGADGDGEARVFVVEEDSLESRRIRVIGTAKEQAAVEGLDEGEQVVVHSFLGWARLGEGMKVKARQ